MNKYGNRKTVIDGQVFDSRKEASRWIELKYMERAGLIKDLQRQYPITLIPSQKDGNGKVIERPSKYVAVFAYTENGKKVIEDVKSSATKTKEYILKRKMLLYYYGIRIKEV